VLKTININLVSNDYIILKLLWSRENVIWVVCVCVCVLLCYHYSAPNWCAITWMGVMQMIILSMGYHTWPSHVTILPTHYMVTMHLCCFIYCSHLWTVLLLLWHYLSIVWVHQKSGFHCVEGEKQ